MLKNWQPVVAYPLEVYLGSEAKFNPHIFNVVVFLGLGLPWLIYSAKEGGEAVTSAALQGDIVQPIIILFIYIGLLLAAMVITKWFFAYSAIAF